jgi:hypothetical protein
LAQAETERGSGGGSWAAGPEWDAVGGKGMRGALERLQNTAAARPRTILEQLGRLTGGGFEPMSREGAGAAGGSGRRRQVLAALGAVNRKHDGANGAHRDSRDAIAHAALPAASRGYVAPNLAASAVAASAQDAAAHALRRDAFEGLRGAERRCEEVLKLDRLAVSHLAQAQDAAEQGACFEGRGRGHMRCAASARSADGWGAESS